MKKSDPKLWRRATDGGAAEPKWSKRWIRRARGGPSEGWISKTAPDKPGDGISVPKSGPRASAWNAGCRRRVARGKLFSNEVSFDV